MSGPIFWVTLLLVSLPRMFQEALVEVMRECPPEHPACVTMTISAAPLEAILTARGPQDSAGWTKFELSIEGRLDSGRSGAIPIAVRGYTGGMDCSAFGQATAAVIGFAHEGEPIVLTTDGPLVVEHPAFVVGCPACAVLLERESYDTVDVLRTPASDHTLAGYNFFALKSYDDAGNLYLDASDTCIQLPPRGHFRIVDHARCVEMQELASYVNPVQGFALQPTQHLFEVPGAKYILFLERGACT